MTSKPPAWYRPYARRMTWLEFNQNIQIDLVHGYVYFEVAKAACSTVKRRLNPIVARGLPDPKVVHPSVFQSPFTKPYQLPDRLMKRVLAGDGFHRFTFLREPTERFVSGYLDKITRDTPQKERFLQRYYPDLSSSDDITVEMFLSALEGEENYKAYDKHWRPQVELIFHPDQELDFVGTTADFEQGWSQLGDLIACVKETTRENVVWHATSAASKVDETLTPDQKRRVGALMAEDYRLYERYAGKG